MVCNGINTECWKIYVDKHHFLHTPSSHTIKYLHPIVYHPPFHFSRSVQIKECNMYNWLIVHTSSFISSSTIIIKKQKPNDWLYLDSYLTAVNSYHKQLGINEKSFSNKNSLILLQWLNLHRSKLTLSVVGYQKYIRGKCGAINS